VLSKQIAYRLLEPALRLSEAVPIVCREGKADTLLAQLAVQRVDLVLSDAPVGPTIRVRALNHLLGECEDSAPLKVLGGAGASLVTSPARRSRWTGCSLLPPARCQFAS